ncbi:hypothetical protein BDB01DRAFT_895705 [Pilobolus umbonatus]|nr:hypothetical protein BDB01DRAFT_895705 [Pilobolus umbonatus]
MKLIFLLAIPTLALTALAASNSANTGTGRPPIKRETSIQRCTEFCLGKNFRLQHNGPLCYCKYIKLDVVYNVYTQEVRKRRPLKPKAIEPAKKRPRDPEDDEEGNNGNEIKRIMGLPNLLN